NAVSNTIGCAPGAVGNMRVCPSPAFDASARSWKTLGTPASALTLTMTTESDLSHAGAPIVASASRPILTAPRRIRQKTLGLPSGVPGGSGERDRTQMLTTIAPTTAPTLTSHTRHASND